MRGARNLFNRRGYDAVSIDEVMAAADLTRGGFYAHFRSKAELYGEAVAFILDEHPARDWEGVDFDLSGTNAARVIVSAYLSEQHLSDVERSCPLVTQASDAARGTAEVKAVYARVLGAMTRAIERSFPEGTHTASSRALAVAALCVGGLALARAVDDPSRAADILQASRKLAMELVDAAQGANVATQAPMAR